MANFLIKVNIPVNAADVVCLAIVFLLCAFAVHVIRGFFKKPVSKKSVQVPVEQEAESGSDNNGGN